MNTDTRITQDRLKAKFHYDPETGEFFRIWRTGRASEPVKSLDRDGYVVISVDYAKYRAAQLAWLYVHGRYPLSGMQMDHIDGNRKNDAIANLREVTAAENSQNRHGARAGKFRGLPLGVYPKGKGFIAQMRLNGVTHRLGNFDTPELAEEAWLKFRRENCSVNTL